MEDSLRLDFFINLTDFKTMRPESGQYNTHNDCFWGFCVQKIFETNFNFDYQQVKNL